MGLGRIHNTGHQALQHHGADGGIALQLVVAFCASGSPGQTSGGDYEPPPATVFRGQTNAPSGPEYGDHYQYARKEG